MKLLTVEKPDFSLSEKRSYKVVKSNNLIQESRFQLTVQEQKIVLYLISQIKPEDEELKEYSFEIIDFCKVCGIDHHGGKAYKNIKESIKSLADRSLWIKKDNEKGEEEEILIRWINKARIIERAGFIKIRLDNDLRPYLLQLKKRFTQYELLYTLAMRSQYSIRMYELLKSYEYKRTIEFDIDELKKKLFAEKYARFPDFKRYVLERAVREINTFSDILVGYEAIKESRRYAIVIFKIKSKKNLDERLETWDNIDKALNPKKIKGQISLFPMGVEEYKPEYREAKHN